MHTIRAAQGEGEANEVQVGDEGTVADYASYADKMLRVSPLTGCSTRHSMTEFLPHYHAGRRDPFCHDSFHERDRSAEGLASG